ncbi:type II secretion system protein GspD [Geofilum rubicundum]|uniref:type II secretion system protein GspD n=1 Tax=Geofilum rubicundum TaxID=472113 RepID=UPI000782AFE1|nr:hypothetical protein [Geofilum rubicundum]
MDSLANTIPALNERLDLSVSELPLNEFIRAVAHESGLNVNIAASLNEPISNNFSNVVVKDILVFLNRHYNIEVTVLGSIIDFRRSNSDLSAPIPTIIIEHHPETNHVSFEINDAPVEQVAREITIQTRQNVVVMPGVSGLTVQSYVKDMPINSALDKLGIGNGFQVVRSSDGFFLFEPKNQPAEQAQQMGMQRQRILGPGSSTGEAENGTLRIEAFSRDSIFVKAVSADLQGVVSGVFEELDLPSYTIGEMTGKVTLDLKGVTLEEFLEHLFSGTPYVSKLKDNIHWFGAREVIGMLDFKMFLMRYRSVDSVIHIIPESIKKGLEIKEYSNLNSLILAGPRDRIKEVSEFLTMIDRVVPVILIEVLIIDNKDSRALSTGISAGLSEQAPESSQTVLPALDVTLKSETVNRLIDGFNDFGWVNLGKVTPNFYLTLQALEEKGFIEMRSTPQLSTLNGHKATMSIGKTEYYKEELNVMYGSVTASSQTTTTYKPVEAEFKLEIRPIVAGNREVTLDILVEQSDFTDRIEKNAPPGKVTRKFESLIRVKDMEMILLGGLEEANEKDVKTGLPLISRIPLISWLTSSRSKSKSKSKLNIFIKPTIIY